MATNLTLAILQADLFWQDASANRRSFQQKILQLSSDVDLIVLPEMFTTGFSMNAAALSEESQGETLYWMQEMAVLKDAAMTGSIIVREQGSYFNRLFFVYPNGEFRTYDKRHTFTYADEHKTYSSGSEKLIVEFRGWKICPLICYDLRFPVWSRNTEDYDLLLYVANWPAPRTAAWDILLQARAVENMAYCVGVNRVGKDGNDHLYIGHSAVYDPLGQLVSTSNYEEEFQQEINLDKLSLKEIRNRFKFLQDRDSFVLD